MTFTLSESDQWLLKRHFQIDDPEILPGLIHARPAHLEGFEVEFEYDQRPPDLPKGSKQGMVRCVQCTTSPNHWLGFVFKHPDGRRMLVGKDCGKSKHDADYEEIKRGFDRSKSRQHDLKVISQAWSKLPSFVDSLAGTADHPSYDKLEQAQADFKTYMKPIYQRLTACARMGQKVIAHEEVPNAEAMAQRRARNKEVRAKLLAMPKSERRRLEVIGELPQLEDESKPIMKTNVIGSFALQGSQLFGTAKIGDNRDVIRGVGRLAKAFYDNLQNQNSANLMSRELSNERVKLESMAQKVLDAMEEIATMANFFESDHLQKIAAWASGHDGDGATYEPVANGLVRNGSSVIGLPPGFALPDDSFLRDFGKEVNVSIKALAA